MSGVSLRTAQRLAGCYQIEDEMTPEPVAHGVTGPQLVQVSKWNLKSSDYIPRQLLGSLKIDSSATVMSEKKYQVIRAAQFTPGQQALFLSSRQPRQEVCGSKGGERKRIRIARNKAADGVSQVFNENIALTGIRISA